MCQLCAFSSLVTKIKQKKLQSNLNKSPRLSTWGNLQSQVNVTSQNSPLVNDKF